MSSPLIIPSNGGQPNVQIVESNCSEWLNYAAVFFSIVIGFGVLLSIDRMCGTKLARQTVAKAPKGIIRNTFMCIHSFFSFFTRTIWVNENGDETGVTFRQEVRRVGRDWLPRGNGTWDNSTTLDSIISVDRQTRSMNNLSQSLD